MNRLIAMLSLFFCVFATPSFAGETVNYRVGNEEFQGYFHSTGNNTPLVLMVHDWDGVTDYEMKRAKMLGELGYSVFVIDLFGRGVRPTERAEKKRLTGALYADRKRMRMLLEGGLQEAAQRGGDIANGVAVGYCFGGAAVLELARAGTELKGFVSFHGGLKTPEGQDYRAVKGPILILHGSADTAVSMSDFAGLAMALEEQKIKHEMITYSGAPHAFTVFGSARYREEADKKSWRRFTTFLQETF